MPQIQINGELREVSQAEYDALTTNGQASTPAAGSYEQYAAARAKEQAVIKLSDADANFETGTNVSPEFRQELTNIRTGADAAAGGNKDAYAARYAQEQQDLYTNAPTSQQALREELSAPPPTTAPGTVGVAVPQQQGTDGQVIGTLNTTIPGVGQPTGPIVSEPVKGLTAGGLTSGAPAAGVESAPSYPTEDPQIPTPSTEGAGTFELPPPPPDAAFRAEQAQQENRWIQAAATNPENINDNGSVTVDLGDGRREIINRDGSYEISGADGTFRFDAAGQQTSYTTPTINGVSVTSTTDGVQVTNITQGPLTTSTITKDGEPISTTVSVDTGAARLTQIETVGGQPVGIIDVATGSEIERTVIVGDEITQEQIQLRDKQVATADAAAIAENNRLREELIAAKEQTAAGIPLSDTQVAALEEQAQVTAAADAELVAAEQALAEVDPTRVPAGEDPQVDAFVDPVTDPVPSLDTVEAVPENVDTAADPEVPPGISTEQIQSNQEAFAEAQATGRENPDGSVTTVDDTGVQTTLFPDGAKTVSDASGTTTFNAEGEATSHTSPTVNGFSETTYADGATTTNQVIPLGPDGEGQGSLTIVTDTTPDGTVVQQQNLDAGFAQAQTVTVDGQLISGEATIADLDGTGQTVLTAPIPEQQTPGFVPAAEIDTAPAEVNPTVDPQINLPADIANAPDPTVAEYFQNKAELEAVQKTFAVEEGDRATFVANPEERAEFIARLEENNQRLEAELEQKGLLDAVQQAEEQDRVENAAAQPPIGSLAELYPDDEPTAVSNSEIVGQTVADTAQGEQELLAAERDVQQTEQQLATAEAELAGTQQEIVDTVRAGGEPTTEQLETLAAQESEVAALEEQLATDEQALVSTQEAQGVDPDPTTLTAAEQAADPEVAAFEEQQAPEEVPLAEIETEADTELTPEEEAADPEVVEPLEEFVSDADIETEDDTELTAEEEAADPEIAPEDDFVLSAADIDSGDDLDQDPGPGYGDVDEPLDPDVLDRANEVEVDPYEDVLGRDLTEEEIQAEDNPVDYDLEEEIDPYNAISDRDAEELSPEDIQAEDNPVDYVLEEEIDPYNAIADNDLTEEEIQAEDNPIDYDTEDEIDPYSAVENSGDPTLTDEEIDAARADQQVEFGPDGLTTLSSAEAARQRSTLDRARAQAILQQQRKQANDGDWRVRLRLAPLAEYLYKADQPGILQPLAVTDGVVFPYTPQITTAYKATYNSYNLTHSNYRGFFYQGSQVEDIQLNATFTAQDTAEANYLLAVIHFFRSVTKMFYGQDATSGAPPPLVFLQGFGEYQFNLAPCVVASFNYVLPADVDYIRAGSPNINGTNLLQRRDRQDLPTNPFSSALSRINNVLKPQGIKKGAIASPPPPPTLGTNRPTYVPTKMEISLILHPMQSREQVSKQFSLKQYANGDLLKGGFW